VVFVGEVVTVVALIPVLAQAMSGNVDAWMVY
jgi:hypothetical protein